MVVQRVLTHTTDDFVPAGVIPADYLLFIIPQLEPFQSLDVL